MDEPSVLAQDLPPSVEDGAGRGHAGAGFHDAGVVAAGDEADFLALGLVGGAQVEGPGALADFGLGEGTEGEEGAPKLRLVPRSRWKKLGPIGVAASRWEKGRVLMVKPSAALRKSKRGGRTSFCSHNRLRYNCKSCQGGGICRHQKHSQYCQACYQCGRGSRRGSLCSLSFRR